MFGDADRMTFNAPRPPAQAAPTPDERVLAALYTHSPCGLGVLGARLGGADPREPLERLLRAGRVVSRQVGDVTVFALVGAMGG